MTAYYSLACKSVKWFRKVLMECISMAVVNSWVLCSRYYDENNERKMPLGSFVKRVTMFLLKIEDQAPVAHIGRQISHLHQLSTIPRRADEKITRKRCYGCHEKLSRQYRRYEATKKPNMFPQNVPYASIHFAYPVSTTSISEKTNAILVQHLQRLILFSLPYVHMCKLSNKMEQY